MNPRSGRARRAIEVYPHPATVALFGLGRTLKYKHKTGRDLDLLRAELLALMGFLEGLADADPALELGEDRLAGAAAPGRDRHPQERAAGRGGPGRRGRLRLRRAVRRQAAGGDHDVRRPRDRLHRHAHAPARAHPEPPTAEAGRDPGRPGARVRPRPPRPGRRRRAVPRAGDRHPRRRRHQLPLRHRSHQDGRVVRREGASHQGRRTPLHRPADARSPTPSGSA